jgi:predicted small secreted protein
MMATTKSPIFLLSFLLMAFLSLTSCQFFARTFLKTTGNLKESKNETPVSVLAYLKKQDARYDGSYIFNDKYSFKYFLDSINENITAIIVFDKGFKNYFRDYICFQAKPTGLDSILNTMSWEKNSNQIHQKLMDRLTIIDGISSINNKKYDLYVFYVWAKYLPKKSNQMIRQINDLYRNFHDRIYFASINVDAQESWK